MMGTNKPGGGTTHTANCYKHCSVSPASDKEKMQPHIYNKETKKLFEKRFKDVNDPLQLVIVRDMWLTGFDAP